MRWVFGFIALYFCWQIVSAPYTTGAQIGRVAITFAKGFADAAR
jgi:hypothetical protein